MIAWHPLKAPHDAARKIAEAFGKAGWEVKALPGEPGDLNAIYGILHGAEALIRECADRGRDYLYVDHGYFGRSKSIAAMDGYYRVVLNELQHTNIAPPVVSALGLKRWDALRLPLQPRRRFRDGDAVLLLPPSEHQCRFYGLGDPEAWISLHKLDLEATYRKDVIVCRKGDGNLENSLDRAALAVGFNSTAMLTLAAQGIVVESLGPSPLFWLPSWMPSRQWEDGRLALFSQLALRQFTVAEIAGGLAG